MITIFTIPNFKGTKIQTLKALILCALIDSLYLIPLLF
jgi:hypothetical protein